MSFLTFDELVLGMISQGVPKERAEAVARRELGITAPPAPSSTHVLENADLWHFPVAITLPWSVLISDNDKHVPNTALLLTKEYREAKRKIQEIAVRAAAGRRPLAMPLWLRARVWLPREGGSDIVNRAKIVHDGLEHAIYANDRWLYLVTWERAGVDVDAPRAELTIAPDPAGTS